MVRPDLLNAARAALSEIPVRQRFAVLRLNQAEQDVLAEESHALIESLDELDGDKKQGEVR